MILGSATTDLILISLATMASVAQSSVNFSCCPQGENLIAKGMCADGTDIKLPIDCAYKYILEDKIEDFAITGNGDLLFGDELIEPNLYCIGNRLNQTNDIIVIVCAKGEDGGNNFLLLRVICAIISVIFITLTIIVYFMVPRLRDMQGQCILHSLFGLALAFMSLSIVQTSANLSSTTCLTMALTIYVTFMLAFFWLNVIAFNVWRTIVIPNWLKKSDKVWHAIYCVYAYGSTLTFFIAVVSAHSLDGGHIRPNLGEGSCFINGTRSSWAYFFGPIATLITINAILFIWTSVKLWSDRNEYAGQKLRNLKYKFLLTMKLFLIMGLLWIFEVLSYATENVNEYLTKFWVITDYVNALQGVLIFLVLVVFRKKALRGIANHSFIGSKLPRSWQTLEDEEFSKTDDENDEMKEVAH